MTNVFDFLDEQLNAFSDHGGIYDSKLKSYCLDLNRFLNDGNGDYTTYLNSNISDIDEVFRVISDMVHNSLFLDFSSVFYALKNFQQIGFLEARDHYYHSMQCFLLSIALYNKFCQIKVVPKNIVSILFSLTIFHDIGYLYQTIKTRQKENNIKVPEIKNDLDSDLADLFLGKNTFIQDGFFRILCMEIGITRIMTTHREEESHQIIREIMKFIKNDSEIRTIWNGHGHINEEYLRILSGVDIYPNNFKEHHSAQSAIMLCRALMTKNIVYKYFCSELHLNDPDIIQFSSISKTDDDVTQRIIKAIFLHDFKQLDQLLSIKTDFYSVYLMIVDELQTYGRQLGTDPKVDDYVINPKDVGFHWDDNRKKLILDIIPTDISMRRKCSKHSNKKIRGILSRKLDITSLRHL
jgi:hypothetical protein